jgi:antibiotic biosynthesis monooxygenase (ABM) superfamily enzyme
MSANDAPEPVTVVVTRRIKSGCEQAYEVWLDGLIGAASKLPGYLGTSVHRPGATGPRDYTSVFRYSSVEHLQGFETSDVRKRALEEVGEFVEGDAIWRELSGLEFWFTPPPGTVVPQPTRWRMAVVMIIVVYLLVFSIGRGVAFVLSDVPIPARLLITITIEVFLMTYFLMPWLTRHLAQWIYPRSKTK